MWEQRSPRSIGIGQDVSVRRIWIAGKYDHCADSKQRALEQMQASKGRPAENNLNRFPSKWQHNGILSSNLYPKLMFQ